MLLIVQNEHRTQVIMTRDTTMSMLLYYGTAIVSSLSSFDDCRTALALSTLAPSQST